MTEVPYTPQWATKAAAARMHYSGDIPPGATKAFIVGVTHAAKIATYTGNDPTIAAGVKANPYTTSNVIVAFYPDKGRVGVYNDPGSYGGFHH